MNVTLCVLHSRSPTTERKFNSQLLLETNKENNNGANADPLYKSFVNSGVMRASETLAYFLGIHSQ
jgi:hypothetical protein